MKSKCSYLDKLENAAGSVMLSALSTKQLTALHDHITHCEQCRRTLFLEQHILHQLLKTHPNFKNLKNRLLHSAASIDERYSPFIHKLENFLGCNRQQVRDLIHLVGEPAPWHKTSVKGFEVLTSGVNHQGNGMQISFARLKANHNVPPHTHTGDELYFVLEGTCCEANGKKRYSGVQAKHDVGTSHSFSTAPNRDLLMAVLTDGFNLETV